MRPLRHPIASNYTPARTPLTIGTVAVVVLAAPLILFDVLRRAALRVLAEPEEPAVDLRDDTER